MNSWLLPTDLLLIVVIQVEAKLTTVITDKRKVTIRAKLLIMMYYLFTLKQLQYRHTVPLSPTIKSQKILN